MSLCHKNICGLLAQSMKLVTCHVKLLYDLAMKYDLRNLYRISGRVLEDSCIVHST